MEIEVLLMRSVYICALIKNFNLFLIILCRILRNFKVEWHQTDMKIRSVLVNVPDVDLKFKFLPVDQ